MDKNLPLQLLTRMERIMLTTPAEICSRKNKKCGKPRPTALLRTTNRRVY